MESKFIKINDYILRKKQIVWVNAEGNKVNIRMKNGNTITTVTETEEEARELLQNIWNLLK